ncbi:MULTISPECIES: hypothetical protein [unclassified Leclercia]|uniref:hypothetical protein n=1 Tax=unclassified Leclercia TaxID=2627398 RepID=UPI002073DBD0|nr:MULTISPECIES: hypothetical protein [unclassified Leclercia]MCM5694851.1 hypothetical protein [Leclercia sp. LTM01]
MNKLARLLLTASSIAPVCITLIFIGWVTDSTWLVKYSLITALVSWFLCIVLVKFAELKLETLHKNIHSLSPANKEVTNYFLSYLFPLLGTDSIAEKKNMQYSFISRCFFIFASLKTTILTLCYHYMVINFMKLRTIRVLVLY